jgi:hypothetical protein
LSITRNPPSIQRRTGILYRKLWATTPQISRKFQGSIAFSTILTAEERLTWRKEQRKEWEMEWGLTYGADKLEKERETHDVELDLYETDNFVQFGATKTRKYDVENGRIDSINAEKRNPVIVPERGTKEKKKKKKSKKTQMRRKDAKKRK